MKGKKKTMPKNDLPEEAPIPFEKVPSPSVSDSDSDYEVLSITDSEFIQQLCVTVAVY